VHPRTRNMLEQLGVSLDDVDITLLDPQQYLDFLCLEAAAAVVITDSGGVQEETTALGIPCITLRENTERPITVDQGTNTVVGTNVEKILACYKDVMKTGGKTGRVPELWDGNAALRIVQAINLWARKRNG
jgi:UDP-N-acetylglucosamine 2-epimerase (non-hydrolysing)